MKKHENKMWAGALTVIAVVCARGGLREVRGDEVLNNFTGEWEKLAEVVRGI